MLKYILKRLGLSIIILLGVSLIIYILVRCMPYDFIEQRMAALSQASGGSGSNSGAALQEMEDALRRSYGITKDPTFWEMIQGYGTWLWALCRLDLGESFQTGTSVLEEMSTHIGVSFGVAFVAIIFEYLIAIPLGVTAATHQYSIRDYVVTVLVMVGISLPSFFLARVLQNTFAHQLGWFYPAGLEDTSQVLTGFAKLSDYLRHLTLPIVSTVILSVGGTMRYMRTNMLEVLNSDYIRTARAKGLKETKVIYKHALRNTMIPIVTMMAGILPSLFSGAMITEQVFNLPGIGQWALKAVQQVDIPVIMSYNMFLAILSVIGVLLSDLMYMVVDPRVKLN